MAGGYYTGGSAGMEGGIITCLFFMDFLWVISSFVYMCNVKVDSTGF